MAGSIEDIFLSCSEPKRNVVEPSLVSVGTAKMIHCRRRCWWWCVQDVRLKITMHRCDAWTCMSAANACWIVLCKCMLDIKCSVLRGWSCAITKSFEFWLRTDEKMGLTLSPYAAGTYTSQRFTRNDISDPCGRKASNCKRKATPAANVGTIVQRSGRLVLGQQGLA